MSQSSTVISALMEAIFALIISLSFPLLLAVYAFRRRPENNPEFPPGSFGWPILGETIGFLFGKPEKFVHDRMKKYSPEIFKTMILGEKTAVICGPNAQNPATSAPARDRPPRGGGDDSPTGLSKARSAGPILGQYGFYGPRALAGPLRRQNRSSGLPARQIFHSSPLGPVLPGNRIIDNPDRITRLISYFDDVTLGMHSMVLNFPGTAFYRANKAAAAIREELRRVVREKKEAMQIGAAMRDILSHMMTAGMPENEAVDKIMGLVVAGYSTVATTITFLMKYVGERPEIYRRIRAEQMEIAGRKKEGEGLEWEDMQKMKYSWNVICETMRLTPPLQGTFREALTDFTYAGYTIPRSWKVYWTVSSTNNNSEYFEDPEKFDPERYERGEGSAPYTYVPFGGGPRTCPGKEYARLAIVAFLHNVVKKYQWEVIEPKEKVVGDMMPTPQNGLPIRLYHIYD
nr:beta-amyrin 28-oxidase-like [Ipomoea batatas]GME15259.1 beta-amyrin 28-oxidase-like [Ipomoea batatas]